MVLERRSRFALRRNLTFVAIVTLAVQLPGPLIARDRTSEAALTTSGGEDMAVALAYASYFADSDCGASISAMAVDKDGFTYVAGSVAGSCLEVPPSVFQPAGNPNTTNGFVAKLRLDGTAFEWATYIGGNSATQCTGIAVDLAGNVYVAGPTYASDLPVRGGFQSNLHDLSCGDGFLAKLDSSGSRLLYSSYLGGSQCDNPSAIAVTDDGRVSVAGGTSSPDFPTTPQAFMRAFPGSSDIGFVSTIDTTQTDAESLVYSTYVGGATPGADYYANGITDISIAESGLVYTCGATNARDFPTTPGAIRTLPPQQSGATAGFLAVLDTSMDGASGLRYSTLVGGTVQDRCSSLAVGPDGSVYVTGMTQSEDFPTTPSAFQTVVRGLADSFVVKVDPGRPPGSNLVYSTLVGGGGYDSASAIAVDANGRATLGGMTSSGDFPVLKSIMHPDFSGGLFFGTLVQLEASGTAIRYSTLYGGGSQDSVVALALDSDGAPQAAIWSFSNRVPVTVAASQPGSPSGPSGPGSVLVRLVEIEQTAAISQPSDIAIPANAVVGDVVGAIADYPAPEITGSAAGEAVARFDPEPGSFLPIASTTVVATVLVDGMVTSAALFKVNVSYSYDTCVSSSPDVRFQIVSSPESPIRGAWQMNIDSPDYTLKLSGVANSIREIGSRAVVFKDKGMKARHRLVDDTWKIRVKVNLPGYEFPVTIVVDAPSASCT